MFDKIPFLLYILRLSTVVKLEQFPSCERIISGRYE